MSDVEKARAALHKESQRVLTEDLANTINAVAGEYDDSILITQLGSQWNGELQSRAKRLGMDEKPPVKWKKLMDSFSPPEQSQLCRLFNHAMWRHHAVTLGDLREIANFDGTLMDIGPIGHPFLLVAFQRSEIQLS